tara:strand:+ start:389 stop:610 length:222 start_codon:yes stop_codon:yes gene_type:complete
MTTHESIIESVSQESGYNQGYTAGYARAKRDAWDVADKIAKYYLETKHACDEHEQKLHVALYIQQQIYTECNE